MGKDSFYVQLLASGCQREIIPIPEGTEFPEEVRQGLDNAGFTTALAHYQEMLYAFYDEVRADPEKLGLPCLEMNGNGFGPMTKQESASRNAFARIGNFLLALGCTGRMTTNGFQVDSRTFREWKIPKADLLFRCWERCGLFFEGYSAGQTADFYVRCPCNTAVPLIIQSFAQTGGKLQDMTKDRSLALGDWRALLSDGKIPLGMDDVFRGIASAQERELAVAFHTRLLELSARFTVKRTGMYNVKYRFRGQAKESVVFDVNRWGELAVHIRPLHVADYAEKFDELSERVRTLCLTGRDCVHCGFCQNAHHFTYQGRNYEKCAIICCNFNLYGLGEEDRDSVLRLLDWELGAR